ncbi:hypothetical protein AOLI_G00253940 [Acnodon oligacanthus]
MKSISVALAVAAAVACLCVWQSEAVPFSQPEMEQQTEHEVPRQEQPWTAASAEETRPEEVLFRTKRQSHISLCRYCCNCCSNKGCGFCCRF